MPQWAIQIGLFLVEKPDRFLKVILSVLGIILFLTISVLQPIGIYKTVPLIEPEQIQLFLDTVKAIEEKTGKTINWQELVAIDAALLNQDFSKATPNQVKDLANKFIWVERIVWEDNKGKRHVKIIYHKYTFEEVLKNLLDEGVITEEQIEDIKRYLEYYKYQDDEADGPVDALPPGWVPVESPEGFVWPVPNVYTITSYFGIRKDPINGSESYHDGLDIAANTGTPVVAAKKGTIIRASAMGTAGKTIIVDIGDETELRYYHLSAIAVHVGDVVEVGEVMGAVGSTGRSTGPHLHFQINKSGDPIDPLPFFK